MTTPRRIVQGTAETVPPTITIVITSRAAGVTLVNDVPNLEAAQDFMAHAWRVHKHAEESGEELPPLRTR